MVKARSFSSDIVSKAEQRVLLSHGNGRWSWIPSGGRVFPRFNHSRRRLKLTKIFHHFFFTTRVSFGYSPWSQCSIVCHLLLVAALFGWDLWRRQLCSPFFCSPHSTPRQPHLVGLIAQLLEDYSIIFMLLVISCAAHAHPHRVLRLFR